MSQYDCKSEFCIFWGEYEFCKCKKASQQMKATFVQRCRAKLKLDEYLEHEHDDLKGIFGIEDEPIDPEDYLREVYEG